MTHRYVAVLMLFAGACMTGPEDAARQPSAGDALDLASLEAVEAIVAEATPSSCVEDGCPTGQSCDWIEGCTDSVTFCCADDQCGKNRYCDFEGGGVCKDRE